MNNDKEIYRLLNKIKLDTSKYEERTLSEAEKDELLDSVKHRFDHSSTEQPKTSSWKRPVLLVAAALFLAFLGLQTPVGQRVQAAASSFLESFRYTITDALGIEERTTDDTSIDVDQVQTIGDAEIKVEDMLIFDDLLLINILVDLGESLEDYHLGGIENKILSINGKEVTDSMLSYGTTVSEDEAVHNRILVIDLDEDFSMTDNYNIELTLEDLFITDMKDTAKRDERVPPVEGRATFSVDTTREGLQKHTNSYSINQELNTDLYGYSIKSLNTHPLFSFIEITSGDWTDIPFEVIEIRGEDNRGNELLFTQHSYTYNGAETHYTGRLALSEEDSDITSEQMLESEELHLQFYSAEFPEDAGMLDFSSYGDPFTIKLNQ
ncbi:hypothetical protein SAMN04488102_102130 [Alkalibacterium subtropicum]|uniref:DUF4179 domain-containing protein n=1 Tax=Alkalibacterium subtropicum TaxID=753702 RepID=A0A1I1FJ84_9LACT|nr:hypothetical protein [Alkalibacterium subtropicum]SFB99351.1 hypothetical protein SAMN04488102_102130 [Alkalibacterium subtropicum]